ncbi:MAG: pyridoxal phosphate-dependent aminotransferase [Balneolaceae bacterium]|nr:MAG: pyridoxal phosphate-dependent aminotransferase [Balneolaceae bacterium]
MIAKRVQAIAPSETMKISGRAKELQREGKSVISLSQGEPDFKTPQHICDAAVQAIRDGHHGYTMNTGNPELRKIICDKLKEENGLEYTPDQIILSNGAKQSIGFSLLATIDPGDEVIIPAPYWVSYPEMVKLAEGKPVIVSTAFENDFKMTADQLRDAITPRTRMLILCSPSNPTGSCYTAEELKALAEVLLEHPGILVLSDEIYEYIVFEEKHVSIAQAAPVLMDRILVINGFSKGFAMTGWRLGYLAGPASIVKAVAKIQSQETSGPSSISQKAGEAAYLSPRSAVTEMVAAFRERRDYLVDALNRIDGVKCFNPGGAFYAFPDISAYLNSETPSGNRIRNSTDLCLFLLEERGLAAVPGDAFGEPAGIRLSYAASMEHLKEAVKRLSEGLAALKKE